MANRWWQFGKLGLMKRKTVMFPVLLMIQFSCSTTADDINSFIDEDVKTYNDKIRLAKSREELWATDPILLMNALFRSDDAERKIVIEFEDSFNGEAKIVLTREGLSDDSVGGEKRIIRLKKMEGMWLITSIRLGFKCWEGRGHTYYSGTLCS